MLNTKPLTVILSNCRLLKSIKCYNYGFFEKANIINACWILMRFLVSKELFSFNHLGLS